jgi:rhodanese-related sulfurtransferase
MKNILIATLLLASCGVFAAELANAPATTTANAETTANAATTAEPFKLIHVKDLAAWMNAKDKKTYIFDANNEQVRTSEGVIPGATILASSSDYVVAQTLPQDKTSNLVFYCANEACSASHNAAKRAVSAGYTNVSVLADGIAGWRKAGQKTAKFQAQKNS